MVRNHRTANSGRQPGVAGIAVGGAEDKGGDQVMQLASLMQKKTMLKKRRAPDENIAMGAYSKDRKSEPIVFEMTLHVPCYVAGRTASGSRWKGKTTTVALSVFGAYLLLPEDVDLKAEISIVFQIPSALKVLFSKDVFRVTAEIRSSGADCHWPAPSGQKVVCVAFSHPLRFTSWAA